MIGRLPAFTLRLLNYLAATVAMLYVINLREDQFSTRRLVHLHAYFFGVVVFGGLAAVLLPDWEFTSPLNYVLPGSLTSNRFAHSLLHPSLAQVQDVLGYAAPRPSAPFVFTNIWGNNLSLLMVWFIVAMWVWGGNRSKIICGVVLAVSLVPIIYSLNRGLWIGLVAGLLYLSVRSAMHGRIQVLLGVGLAGFIITSLVLISPLYTVIQERVANPHSNTARESTSGAAVTAALSSPVLGYGSTRAVVGSAQSAAVGRSASCPQCGNAAIGGAGQLWLLLIAQGFTGVLLYVGFFARTLWVYRRDHSPVAMAGFLVIALGLLYLPVYGAAGSPLAIYMLAVALLYRQRQQAERAALDGDPVDDLRFRPLAPRTIS
jgi:hypothetical protein